MRRPFRRFRSLLSTFKKTVFRKTAFPLLLWVAWILLAVNGFAAVSVNDGFDPNANNTVMSIALQPDGKILTGGYFTAIGGTARNRIARLNADGSLDTTFNPDANGSVESIALQADGKIIIGGYFTTIGVAVCNYIARLNADGSLDTTFNPNANSAVLSIALQPDGKIIIGGPFTTIGGTARNYIARLNANGSLDTTFNPDANSNVNSIALQSDGKIIIGGGFHTIGGTARNHIARINADGSLDTTFNPDANNRVSSMVLQPDGKIIIGGYFTTIGGTAKNYIARINADGGLDTTFNPDANGSVDSIALQPDGKIIIGGNFSTIGGATRNRIARLNADGSLDTIFNPNANGNFVFSIAVQPDGKILIGGPFTTVGGTARNYIARLNADGSLDTTFNPDANSTVSSIALQPDGKILIGGNFTTIWGTARNRIARLTAEGSLDTTFNPNANNWVFSITLQPDGKILIGGNFTTIGGAARNYIARLNVDGSLDTTFNPNANSNVYSIALQPDGKIVIGGYFTTIGGIARNRIARLNADGGLDTTFNPDANNIVYSIALQPDGKIIIGGNFTTIGGAARNLIARLNADGSLDTIFNPNANNMVLSIALQPDGKIIIGGYFTTIGGTARNRIAHLNADGSLDTTFNPDANNIVYSIALQSDGKIIIGGYFTTIGGTARNYIARLSNDLPALQNLSVSTDRTAVTWVRSGSGPEIYNVVFEQSSDGSNWTSLGTAARISGGWQLTGLSIPLYQNRYIRARGATTGGNYNSSHGILESVKLFYNDLTPPSIGIGSPSATVATSGPVTYTVTYTGADTVTLANANVTLNTTGTANGTVGVSGTGASTRTVTISSITGNGTLGISIASGTASDTAGNLAPAAGPSTTFTVDNTAPTTGIGSPSATVTKSGPVTYTVTYTGADTVTLANANVTLNTTGTANGTIGVTGSGTSTRTVTISSITGNGTLGISIAAGTASDTAGNLAPAAGPSATFTVDNTAPTTGIGSPSATVATSGPVTYTVTYTGADTVTLANANVTLNTTGTANGTIGVTGSGTSTRTVTISSITGNGTLGISIAAGTASDTAGNLAAAVGPSATFTVDNTAPTTGIGSPSATVTKSGPVTYTVTYTGADAVTLAAANVTLNKTGTANGTVAVSGTGNTTRMVTISGITGNGTLGISMAAGTASDTAGNLAAAVGPSATFTVDNTVPAVTANPRGGAYSSSQNVALTPSEAATIYYTTDGSPPTTSSPVYSTPVSISSSTVLKFFAQDSAGNSSPIYSETYTMQGFSLSAADLIKVVQGETRMVAITITSIGGFNSPVTLTYAFEGTPPANAGVVLTSVPVTPTPEGANASLQFTAAQSTLVGTYTLRITAAGAGLTTTKDIQITVLLPVGISSTSLPDGVKGQTYTLSIGASGGIPPYTFSRISGSLPDGLILNPDGSFSGTPTARGTFNFTIQLQDSAGHTASKDYAIRVYDPSYRTFVMAAQSWTVEKSVLPNTSKPSSWITITVMDDYGNPVNVAQATRIQIMSSSTTGQFTEDGASYSSYSYRPYIQADTNVIEVQYRDTTLGIPTLTVSGVSGQPSEFWQAASHAMTVTSPNLQNATLAVSVTANATYGQGVMVTGSLKNSQTNELLAYKTIAVSFTSPAGTQTPPDNIQTGSWGTYTYTAASSIIDAAGEWRVQATFKDTEPAQYNEATNSATFNIAKANTWFILNELGSTAPDDQVIVNGQLRSYTYVPDLSGIDIIIEFMEPDGTTLHSDTATTYNSEGHFSYTYPTPFANLGLWTIQAKLAATGNLNGIESDKKSLVVATSAGYAILIQGDSGGVYRNNYAASLDDIYKKLLKQSFTDDTIYYLSYSGAAHETGIPIDDFTSRDTIIYAITNWAVKKIDEKGIAPLYIILMDHGSKEVFHLDPQRITPDDLDGWLSTLEKIISDKYGKELPVVIVNGSCYSGSFIPKLKKQGRIVITSSAEDEESAQGPVSNNKIYGEYFVYYLFNYLAAGKNLQDAFKDAAKVTHQVRSCMGISCGTNSLSGQGNTKQHPLLDDNGDGKGSWMDLVGRDDGAISARLILGLGTNPVTLSIKEVMPTAKLPAGTTNLTAWAKTSDPNTPGAASWVEVRKPSYVPPDSGGTGQVIMNLPKVPGKYSTDRRRWEYWEYPPLNNLPEAGTYTLYYYVMDSNGDVLPPVMGTFYVNTTNNQPPAAFNLIEPPNGQEVNDAMMVFRWENAKDPESKPVTYTIRFYEDVDGFKGDEIKRYELIPQAFFYLNAARERRADGMTSLFATGKYYWWEAEAIDDKGATTVSAPRRFHVIFTNAITGVITGIIYSDVDYSRITTASLTATIGGSNTPIVVPVTNGAFVLAAPPGTVALASTDTADVYRYVFASDINVKAGEVTTLNIGMAAVAKPGDLDGSGHVDITDAIMALQLTAGRPPAITPHLENDINGDGKIGTAEAIYILQKVTGVR